MKAKERTKIKLKEKSKILEYFLKDNSYYNLKQPNNIPSHSTIKAYLITLMPDQISKFLSSTKNSKNHKKYIRALTTERTFNLDSSRKETY